MPAGAEIGSRLDPVEGKKQLPVPGWSRSQLAEVIAALNPHSGSRAPAPEEVLGVELLPVACTSVKVLRIELSLDDGGTLSGFAKLPALEQEWQAHRRAAMVERAARASPVRIPSGANGELEQFFLMPVEGVSLHEAAQRGQLTESIAEDAGRALAELHAGGVVHTDLRRDHCFVRASGDGDRRVFFIDFSHAILCAPRAALSSEQATERNYDVLNLRWNVREWGIVQRELYPEAPAPFELVEAFDRGLSASADGCYAAARAALPKPGRAAEATDAERGIPRSQQRALYDLAVQAEQRIGEGDIDGAWSVIESMRLAQIARRSLPRELSDQLAEISRRVVNLRIPRQYPNSPATAIRLVSALGAAGHSLSRISVFGSCRRQGEVLVDIGSCNHNQHRDLFSPTVLALFRKTKGGFHVLAAACGKFEPEPRSFEVRSIVYRGARSVALRQLLDAVFDSGRVALWWDDRKLPGGVKARDAWYLSARDCGRFFLRDERGQLEVVKDWGDQSCAD